MKFSVEWNRWPSRSQSSQRTSQLHPLISLSIVRFTSILSWKTCSTMRPRSETESNWHTSVTSFLTSRSNNPPGSIEYQFVLYGGGKSTERTKVRREISQRPKKRTVHYVSCHRCHDHLYVLAINIVRKLIHEIVLWYAWALGRGNQGTRGFSEFTLCWQNIKKARLSPKGPVDLCQ